MNAKDEIIQLAKDLHVEYENQARLFNWKTQKECRVDFDDLPEANKKTMLGVAMFVHAHEQEAVGRAVEPIKEVWENYHDREDIPICRGLEAWNAVRKVAERGEA